MQFFTPHPDYNGKTNEELHAMLMEEEARLIKKWKEENPESLAKLKMENPEDKLPIFPPKSQEYNDILSTLFSKIERWVLKCLNKNKCISNIISKKGLTYEEVVVGAFSHLYTNIRKYDNKRGSITNFTFIQIKSYGSNLRTSFYSNRVQFNRATILKEPDLLNAIIGKNSGMEEIDQQDLIDMACRTLSPRQQQVIEAHNQYHSGQAAADALEITYTNYQSHLTLAKNKLKKFFREFFDNNQNQSQFSR